MSWTLATQYLLLGLLCNASARKPLLEKCLKEVILVSGCVRFVGTFWRISGAVQSVSVILKKNMNCFLRIKLVFKYLSLKIVMLKFLFLICRHTNLDFLAPICTLVPWDQYFLNYICPKVLEFKLYMSHWEAQPRHSTSQIPKFQ